MKKVAISMLCVVSVFIFPVFFLFSKNAAEVNIAEVIMPLILFALCGVGLYGISYLIVKDVYVASTGSIIAGLVLLNYNIIEKLSVRFLPMFRAWQIAPVIVIGIYLAIYFINKKLPTATNVATTLAGIAFGGLCLFNAVMAAGPMLQGLFAQPERSKYADIVVEHKPDRPNMYFIMCDEYAGFAQTKNMYGYDNTLLKTYFDEKGFTSSDTSRNYISSTEVVMANLFRLEYVATRKNTLAEVKKMREIDPPFLQILNKAGYSVQGIGDTGWLGIPNIMSVDKQLSVTADGKGFISLLVEKTVISGLNQIQMVSDDAAILTANSFDVLSKISVKPNNSLFNFFYVNSPHPPYYFDKNGNINIPSDFTSSLEPRTTDLYLGQLEYTTKRIIQSVDNILKQDPSSIIIVGSDHGFRFSGIKGDEDYFLSILNSVYYKGEALPELEGKSTINTMLLLFNKEFDLNLEYLEVPHEQK